MSSTSHSSRSRRTFLKQAGAVAAAAALPSRRAAGSQTAAKTTGGPAQGVVKNRAPLAANAFYTLPLGSIRPAGWLLSQLQTQASGLSGHLDEVWPDVGPNSGWLGGTGESWERGPYFVDGLVPLAYELDDERLKAKAQKFIEWTIIHQASDGMIGPASNDDWWPRMVMLKALIQYQEATGDARVIPLLERYFAYQLQTLGSRPLKNWGKFRWQDNALAVIWLYNRNGDGRLLDLVRLLHSQGFDWQANFADFKYTSAVTAASIKLSSGKGLGAMALASHGVNNGQALKAAPVWSLVSGDADDRKGFQQMLDALDQYHGLPNGMFSCDEHLAGRNPAQGSELCTVVETMFSLEQSLAILGDAKIGDRLEVLAFNALPGTFTDDMWAHQYDQEPNQVEVSLHRKPWTTDGPESNIYGLEPHFGCCTANFHQGWPKFTSSLWMASHDDGLVAAAYAPCDVHTMVRGDEVELSTETEYPFREQIYITIKRAGGRDFPIRLRIPAWAQTGVTLTVNGEPQPAPAGATFAVIQRAWKAGDKIELRLPIKPRVLPGYNGSVSVRAGSLVFSLPVDQDWLKLRDRGPASDWQVFPASSWNYAIATAATTPQNEGELKLKQSAIGSPPFTRRSPGVTIDVSASKVPTWRAVDGVADPMPQSPVPASEPAETVTLIPYAAAKLRITAFPRLESEGS
jgi:hypothetical protein